MGFRTSDGSRLLRSDKVTLDLALIEVADKSYANGGEAVTANGYDTEKDAKATLAKLRKAVNDQGRGLRASQPFLDDDGTYAFEFKVLDKRDTSPKSS